MAHNDGIQLLLDFAKDTRRADSRKVPVYMLIDNFDECKQLCQ